MSPTDNSIPTTPTGWDNVADSYGAHITRFTALHAMDLISAAETPIRSAKTILDIGCGAGASALAYISKFPLGIEGQTVIFSDLSPKMINIAEQEARKRMSASFQTKFKFQVEDGTTLEGIEDGSVDVVLSVFGVFLISPRDAVLVQVKRVLRVGGVFANAAWTALPQLSSRELQTTGFSNEFQKTVSQIFATMGLPSEKEGDEEDPWKMWSDPDAVRGFLGVEKFENVVIHRTIHSTTFRNIDLFWELISKTCPFADLSKTSVEKLAEIKEMLKEAFRVSNFDVVFMIMSSNLSVCNVGTV